MFTSDRAMYDAGKHTCSVFLAQQRDEDFALSSAITLVLLNQFTDGVPHAHHQALHMSILRSISRLRSCYLFVIGRLVRTDETFKLAYEPGFSLALFSTRIFGIRPIFIGTIVGVGPEVIER